MPTPRIDPVEGKRCVQRATAAWAGGTAPERTDAATAVRYLLQVLTDAAPGKSVEVRVPPFGAVQCVEGLSHTRGTPPNVVEMDAPTWVALATGTLGWSEAVAGGRVSASGSRSDISELLPLAEWDS
jgi:hypothetical protein